MTPENTFSFSAALQFLKDGKLVSRLGWNGKNQTIAAQFPDENSKMSLPYLYIKTVDGNQVPWLASQTDIMSDDWFLVVVSDESNTLANNNTTEEVVVPVAETTTEEATA